MKFVKFRTREDEVTHSRLGLQKGASVIDLVAALTAYRFKIMKIATDVDNFRKAEMACSSTMNFLISRLNEVQDLIKTSTESAIFSTKTARELEIVDVVYPIHDIVLKAPVEPRKIICLALTYKGHAAEMDLSTAKFPEVFFKPPSAVIGPEEPIILPTTAPTKVDFEAELGIVIGKMTRFVKEEEAMDYVAGYTALNDVTARDVEFEWGLKQWALSKSFDTFAPIGPCITTKDEIEDPNNLDIRLRLNGEIMQESNTSDLRFSIPKIVSMLSTVMTLETGDVISTGTPPGVGYKKEPPVFLRPGDVCEVEIEGLNILRNPVEGG
ncbi:MAG: fumarylacetoacetate hydrolase family protein [Candidatus Hodarchaeota archaeon]